MFLNKSSICARIRLMNIPPNGFAVHTGVPLPFAPPPPGAPPTFVAPSDSWTPSGVPAGVPAYQPQPTFQAQTAAPARDDSYQFACFRPENWTYPSSLTNNTYTPGTSTPTNDSRAALLRQREEAHNQNRRNMAAGWNNYSRSIVDPNRGYGGPGQVQGYGNQYGNQYGNGYNNSNPGSYLYGNNAGMRRPGY